MIFNKLCIYLNKFNHFLSKHLESSMQFVIPFSWICLIGFPLYFLLYIKTENAWIDILGTLISLIVILSKNSIIIKSKYLPIFWFLFLIYFLPFNFTYNLFINYNQMPYALGEIIMLMTLSIIVANILLLSIILGIGIIIAILIYGNSLHVIINNLDLINTGPVYLLGLAFGIALTQKKEITEKLKLEGATTLVHRISHEINTPLAVLTLAGETLRMNMPSLLETYKIAKEKNLEIPKLQPHMLGLLNDVPNTISNECNAANAIISILLMNARDPQNFTQNYKETSMYKCIEQAISRYAYVRDFDQEKINWIETEDFNFYGIEILMVHVLLNLIKNANRAILETGKGTIKISNNSDGKYNYLYFEDTAIGIKKEISSHLFDSFYTTNPEGTGLGLFFCKKVIEGFNGKIWCESAYQEYTKFVIRLPLYQLGK